MDTGAELLAGHAHKSAARDWDGSYLLRGQFGAGFMTALDAGSTNAYGEKSRMTGEVK